MSTPPDHRTLPNCCRTLNYMYIGSNASTSLGHELIIYHETTTENQSEVRTCGREMAGQSNEHHDMMEWANDL